VKFNAVGRDGILHKYVALTRYFDVLFCCVELRSVCHRCVINVPAVTCVPMLFSHIVNSSDTSVGAVILASCRDGFQVTGNSIVGNLTAICQASGKWSPEIPECRGKQTQYYLQSIEIQYQ